MKKILELKFSGSRRVLAAVPLVGAWLACGVVEHPHDVQAIDTSKDFEPTAGSAVSPTAGTSAGGMPATSGAPATGGTLPTGAGQSGVGQAGTSASGSPSVAGSAGGPPLSGVTIALGGVNVPKEKAIAFIHVGHSNMAGQARSPQGSRAFHYETHPRAYMYHAGSAPALAVEPKTAGGPGAGPGTALVKEAALAAPDYYFISLGHGEPSAYCSQFLPGALYYEELIAAPKAIKGKVTFGGIFIYLGITERHGSAADLNGFPNCVKTLVDNIRKDVGEPNLPALMNDYEVDGTGEFAVGGAVATAIMPQIAKCPSVVSNFALVSSDDVGMQDDHHFNFDGQRNWVQRAFVTMKDKGWRFWAP